MVYPDDRYRRLGSSPIDSLFDECFGPQGRFTPSGRAAPAAREAVDLTTFIQDDEAPVRSVDGGRL